MKCSFDPMNLGGGFSEQTSMMLETSYLYFKRNFHEGTVHVETSHLYQKMWQVGPEEAMSWFWVATKNQKCQNPVVRQPGVDQSKVRKCSHDQLDHFYVLPELLNFFFFSKNISNAKTVT